VIRPEGRGTGGGAAGFTATRLHARGAAEGSLGVDERRAKFIDCMAWAEDAAGDDAYARASAMLDGADVWGALGDFFGNAPRPAP
jgi:hypothetical protein